MRLSFVSTFLCFVALSITAGCQGPENDSARQTTVLKRSLQSDPDSLDPHKFRTFQSNIVLRDIGEGLVGYSPRGEITPLGAESWTVAEDGLSYTFKLRSEATWSNGDPVVAQDYLRAFRRLFDPQTASPSADDASMMLNASEILAGGLPPERIGVSAEDSHTLKIVLETPTPYFLQILSDPSLFPMHKEEVEGKDEGDYNDLSNGAYLVEESDSTYSNLLLTRNRYYWNDQGSFFDEVKYRSYAEQAHMNAFRTGLIDLTDTIPVHSFTVMKDEAADQMVVSPGFVLYYYGFNLTQPPFEDNKKLREALSIAIDRKALVEKVTGRGEIPAFGMVPPGIPGYSLSSYEFSDLTDEERLALARNAYEEAGFSISEPAQFELRYNTSEDHQRIAVAVQSMWKEALGADVELVNEEFRVLVSSIQSKSETQAFRLGWSGSYLDPYAFLQLFESDNPNNLTGYSNANVDSLLHRSSSELDIELRMTLLEEAERLIMQDYPLIPIYFLVNKHMVSDEILGFEPNLLDVHYSKHLSRDE